MVGSRRLGLCLDLPLTLDITVFARHHLETGGYKVKYWVETSYGKHSLVLAAFQFTAEIFKLILT